MFDLKILSALALSQRVSRETIWEELGKYTKHQTEPQIRRDYPLNLSIIINKRICLLPHNHFSVSILHLLYVVIPTGKVCVPREEEGGRNVFMF